MRVSDAQIGVDQRKGHRLHGGGDAVRSGREEVASSLRDDAGNLVGPRLLDDRVELVAVPESGCERRRRAGQGSHVVLLIPRPSTARATRIFASDLNP